MLAPNRHLPEISGTRATALHADHASFRLLLPVRRPLDGHAGAAGQLRGSGANAQHVHGRNVGRHGAHLFAGAQFARQ